MKTLQEIYEAQCAAGYETDKGSVHSYIEVYEEILLNKRTDAKAVLEIGVFKGNSLRMWQQYFNCPVYGIDCDETPHGGLADLREMIASGEFYISIFDAANPELVEKYFSCFQFDVIIEDANHQLSQQIELYNIWKKYLSPDGIYIIEDVENIDESRKVFEGIDAEKSVTILDRRNLKNRFDDVLVIIK